MSDKKDNEVEGWNEDDLQKEDEEKEEQDEYRQRCDDINYWQSANADSVMMIFITATTNKSITYPHSFTRATLNGWLDVLMMCSASLQLL